jgi:trimeric autotransporter adhesin
MKAPIFLTMLCLFWINMVAQTPQKMSYQAVVRNVSGALVTNHAVGIKISILQGSPAGTVVYAETYNPVPVTNANGLVSLEIGNGAPVTGTFGGINWSAGPYYVRVESDTSGGTSYTVTGVSQLLSVPYALYAKDVQNNNDADYSPTNEIQTLSLSGSTLGISGGNSVTLPSAGDNWGIQAVVTDASLTGIGTTATPLKIADNGVNSAKIQDAGIVTADLADQTVSTAKLGNLAVSADKLQNGAVTTDKINAGAVTGAKIAQAGATNGQAMKWNNSLSTWAPADDATGGGFTIPYAGSTSTGGGLVFSITETSGGSAIYGRSSMLGAAGDNYGVKGESGGINGIGVYGVSTSRYNYGVMGDGSTGVYGTGSQFGVRGSGDIGVEGQSNSTSGYGVKGFASNATGISSGVYGSTNSDNGYGIYGISPYQGVYGKSTKSGGSGVYGEITAAGGSGVTGKSVSGIGVQGNSDNIGLYGSSSSANGYGLYTESPKYGAYSRATGSSGRAIVGEATGTTSIGVKGIASNTSSTGVWGEGSNQGVYGESALSTGKGVYGMASSTSGINFGVYGKTASQAGSGVYGDATASGGETFGVYGKSASDLGVGVFGYTSSSSGVGYGVWGKTESGYGWGVYGEAVSTTGESFGVYGRSKSSTGCGVAGASPKYGTYGGSTGSQGRAIWGEALGTSSIGVYGKALADNSTGVYGEGSKYDFYAAGTGIDYGTSSSIRWKKNILSIPDPIGKIKAIRGVFFDWDEAHGGKHNVGMIAEEVGKVLPEIVDYEENGIDAIGMDYSKMTPLLLEGIKAQQAEIELLKKENERLKTENERLKAKDHEVISRIERLEKLVEASALK